MDLFDIKDQFQLLFNCIVLSWLPTLVHLGWKAALYIVSAFGQALLACGKIVHI